MLSALAYTVSLLADLLHTMNSLLMSTLSVKVVEGGEELETIEFNWLSLSLEWDEDEEVHEEPDTLLQRSCCSATPRALMDGFGCKAHHGPEPMDGVDQCNAVPPQQNEGRHSDSEF